MLIILAIGMAVTFGIAGIFFSEITSSGQISSSVKSFYAADAAIEAALYKDRNSGAPTVTPFTCDNSSRDIDVCLNNLNNGASYTYTIIDGGGGCPGGTRRTISAIGILSGTRRSIEISYCV